MNYKFTIQQDNNADGPRELDNLGTMVCWHRRYGLGDAHTFCDDGYEDTPEGFKDWWKRHGKGGIRLPLYVYDHNGITMNTTGFTLVDSAGWDWGCFGYYYVTLDTLHKEYGKRITPKRRRIALACLHAEIQTYDHFLTGNVYGFILSKTEDQPQDNDFADTADWADIDSVWGFYADGFYSNLPAFLHQSGMQEHLDTPIVAALLNSHTRIDHPDGSASFLFSS